MNLKKCEFHKNMREKINLSIFLLAVGKNGKLVCTETLDEKKLLHMKVRTLHQVNTLAKGCYSYCKSYTQFPFTDISFRIIFYALQSREILEDSVACLSLGWFYSMAVLLTHFLQQNSVDALSFNEQLHQLLMT